MGLAKNKGGLNNKHHVGKKKPRGEKEKRGKISCKVVKGSFSPKQGGKTKIEKSHV